MPYVTPGKGLLLDFNLNGNDLTPFTNVIRVFETVCKPYITAQVIIFDTDNLIQSLGIVAGMDASLTFISPPQTRIYTAILKVLKMKGEPAPETLKFQIYTIDFTGPEYWGDRLNTVRNSFQNLTGSAAIQALWGQYIPGSSLSADASDGMIGSQAQPSTHNGQKPFTAMYDIMKKMVGGAEGNWLLYRDRDSSHLRQLTKMLSEATSSPIETFLQGETWGATFNDPDVYRIIIVAQMQAGRGDGGAASAVDLSKFAAQSQTVADIGLGKILKDGMNTSGGGLGGIASKFGGRFNKQMTNSAGIENAVAPFTKTIQEGLTSAQVRNGPQITLKVPMQTGLEVTVGQGIHASLLPPTQREIVNAGLYDRNWLVTDLCHELYCDNRELNATTTFQGVTNP